MAVKEETSDRSFGEVEEVEETEETPEDNVQGSEEVEEVEETKDGEVEKTKDDPTGDPEEEETTETKDPETKLTEKGTKLDPNPQSAVHQQLANEKAKSSQYEKVLSNPQLLAQYTKNQFGKSESEDKETKPEVKEYKAEDFGNLDDVAKVVNELQKTFGDKTKTYEEKITELNKSVAVLTQREQQSGVASNIEREVQSISKLPEFDPKSPEYVKGLQERIVQRFNELDFDKERGFFRGQVSIAKLAEDAIENIKLGRKSGSLKAQTIIKKKSKGQIKTSPKVDVDAGKDNLTPGDSIAAGIKKLNLR